MKDISADEMLRDVTGLPPPWWKPHRRLEWRIAKWALRRFMDGHVFDPMFVRCDGCGRLRSLRSRHDEIFHHCGWNSMKSIKKVSTTQLVMAVVRGD